MPDAAGLLLLLDRRIAALRKNRQDLEDAIRLQDILVRTALTSARAPHITSFPIPREALAGRIRAGVPLLHEQPATVDFHFAADLFSRLVNALEAEPIQAHEDQANGLEAIVEAATNGALDAQALFSEAFVHHVDHIAELAHQAGVDAELLGALATVAVAPVLRAYAERLLPLVDRADDGSPDGAIWQRGYCPICGGWPSIAELRGVELSEHLRCSGCGSGWRWVRIGCPYCGTSDYRSLQMLTIEGEPRFKVSCCDRCQGYIKVGNAFDPPPAELVALDDLASMHLDVAAIERGYRRPEGSGYVIELAVPDNAWADELEEV